MTASCPGVRTVNTVARSWRDSCVGTAGILVLMVCEAVISYEVPDVNGWFLPLFR